MWVQRGIAIDQVGPDLLELGYDWDQIIGLKDAGAIP